MITKDFAAHFAQAWITAWNDHDLDQILSHYTDDFEMTSPFIVSRMQVPSGTLKGKAKVADYWALSLAAMPDLHFNLHQITYGVNSMALYYDSVLNKKSIEWFFFDDNGQVTKSVAQYDEI